MTSFGTGLDSVWGFAEEPYPGNTTTVTRFLPVVSASFQPLIVDLPVPALLGRGSYVHVGDTKFSKRGGTGSVQLLVTNNAFGLILKQLGQGTFSWPGSTPASQTLTSSASPATTNTVTIGTTVYTYKTALTAPTTAYEVLIGASELESNNNLAAAINGGAGEGVLYGSYTPAHPQVTATATLHTVVVTDKLGAGASAAYATTETHANATWGAATVAGGVNGTDTARLATIIPHPRGGRRLSMTSQQAFSSVDSGVLYPWTYSGIKPTSATLTLTTDNWLVLDLTFTALDAVTSVAIATPSYASNTTIYDYSQAALTLDAVASDVIGFTFNLPLPLADRVYLGNVTREQVRNAMVLPTGAVDCHFTSQAHYAAWLAQTHAALILTLTGATIAGSASAYMFRLTLPVIEWTGASPVATGPDIVPQPRPFRVLDDSSNPPWKIEYRSVDSAF